MLEKINRRLGQALKHTVTDSNGVRFGRATWACGCSLSYIDMHGREPIVVQLTPCRPHSREGEQEVIR
jgi:hypothetical protein